MYVLFEVIFWLSVFLSVYTYLLYPIVLILIAAYHQVQDDRFYLAYKRDRRVSDLDELPKVAIVIAAYNEEKHIEQRLKNLLNLDYPKDRYKIYIGSDGSDDATPEIIRTFVSEGVVYLDYRERRGKASILNDIMAQVKEPLVVFSDANTEFAPDDLRKLVRHFADPQVGAVCGELLIRVEGGSDNQDSLYWRTERMLKFYEGRLGGLLGANGANYAIRRELFVLLPCDTIVDDFTIVMNIAAAGHKIIYDAEAMAYEPEAPSIAAEFTRRIRIGMGNYQAFFRLFEFMNPLVGVRVFTYVSHKVLRWFVPHLLFTALLTSALLYDVSWYTVLFWMQVYGYTACYVLYIISQYRKLPRRLLFPIFIMAMNLAFAIGFIRYLKGGSSGIWQRTLR
jgi:cellulose synthase/poly-beta-1,6-N-acetylglucosamine synthase-like glycosyltransferase